MQGFPKGLSNMQKLNDQGGVLYGQEPTVEERGFCRGVGIGKSQSVCSTHFYSKIKYDLATNFTSQARHSLTSCFVPNLMMAIDITGNNQSPNLNILKTAKLISPEARSRKESGTKPHKSSVARMKEGHAPDLQKQNLLDHGMPIQLTTWIRRTTFIFQLLEISLIINCFF